MSTQRTKAKSSQRGNRELGNTGRWNSERGMIVEAVVLIAVVALLMSLAVVNFGHAVNDKICSPVSVMQQIKTGQPVSDQQIETRETSWSAADRCCGFWLDSGWGDPEFLCAAQ